MPELPEVETSCAGIRPWIEGQTLCAVNVYQKKLRWPVPETALQNLVGQTLTKVERRAKYIKLHCQSGFMLVHLGMSGNLRILDAGSALKKHDHIDITFANQKLLRFHDPRKFGCFLYQAYSEGEHPLLTSLGPEPLTDDFNADYLFALSRNKKQAIKTWLMDNQVVVGVGNIYAAEALFEAGIHPKRAAGNISYARYQRLVAIIKATLLHSIEQGGSSLKDFLHSDGKPGYFQQSLAVYGREGLACIKCIQPIKRIKLGQRSSFYCSHCQK